MASNERSPWYLPSSEHPCSICPCTANMIFTATLPQCNFLAYLVGPKTSMRESRQLVGSAKQGGMKTNVWVGLPCVELRGRRVIQSRGPHRHGSNEGLAGLTLQSGANELLLLRPLLVPYAQKVPNTPKALHQGLPLQATTPVGQTLPSEHAQSLSM